ncbi:MAG: ABC transporter ATP-binding protein [Ilumatobacteraceae bacterium]|nr:ABC transporter ATP-binding protein [Ilumatobacteraceae bacterium]
MASTLDTEPEDPTTGTPPNAGTQTGASIAISDVTVAYDSPDGADTPIDAVRDATLEISAGSIVALLGPSGCGKTSLLRAVAGLERPRTGSITIGGRVVSDSHTWMQPERRNVGMVFQDGALFPHLTVAQNITFGLRGSANKMSKRARTKQVEEMLHLVDLDEFGDRLPGTLSGGQQQRVALARSLAPQPSVLLLDEPFSALDAALRLQLRAEVARIVRRIDVTTIFVTHDQDEAFVLGDQVAVLRDGRIEQVGTPDDLYRRPNTRWVAGFVGEANLIRGRFDSAVDGATPHEHVGEPNNTSGVQPNSLVANTLLGPVPLSTEQGRAHGDVEVLVRPEQVELRPGDCALITDVEYYGHDVRYELQLNDGSILAARATSSELYENGDRVCVRFSGGPTEAWPTAGSAHSCRPLPTDFRIG